MKSITAHLRAIGPWLISLSLLLPAAARSEGAREYSVIQVVNSDRQAQRLAPVEWSDALADEAREAAAYYIRTFDPRTGSGSSISNDNIPGAARRGFNASRVNSEIVVSADNPQARGGGYFSRFGGLINLSVPPAAEAIAEWGTPHYGLFPQISHVGVAILPLAPGWAVYSVFYGAQIGRR